MKKAGLNSKVSEIIERKREDIIQLGSRIYENPETGFKEYKTSRLVADAFHRFGLSYEELDDIPGVKATIDTGKDGPGVAVISELDAIICAGHVDCNKETGAVHACGHNIQIASMLGAAAGILESDALLDMAGKIHLIAVPAEEFIEISFRLELREKGRIRYLGGKPELLRRGMFDDVDICVMVHALPGLKKFGLQSGTNGCIVKKAIYKGKASHAGGAPHEGINALYAANLGLSAVNAVRETFREEDYIRVHPIITKGGDTVNVIPSEVCIETFVRGKSMDAIVNTGKKVDRALVGGAVSMGAKIEIKDIPGYFPLSSDNKLTSLARTVMTEFVDEDDIADLPHGTICTDLGDLSALMPVIHPYIGGVEGGLHSIDYRVCDADTYILGAKFLAFMVVELLKSNACSAESIISSYTPLFKSRNDYFNYADKLFSTKEYSLSLKDCLEL